MNKEELKIFNDIVKKAKRRATIYISENELEVLMKIKKELNDGIIETSPKTYVCIKDLQGDSFGMYRNYSAEEWKGQALEWAEQDSWDEEEIAELEKLKTDKEIIDYVSEVWDLDIQEVNKNNQSIIDYVKQEIENFNKDYNSESWEEDFIIELRKELGI